MFSARSALAQGPNSIPSSSVPLAAIIVPCVIGGLLLISLIIFAIVMLNKKRQRERNQEPVQPEQLDPGVVEMHAVAPPPAYYAAPPPAHAAYNSAAAFAAMQATSGQLRYTEANLRNTCIVCMNLPKNALYRPCNHVCCCVRCSEDQKECPMCRAPIGSVQPLMYGQTASLEETYLLSPCGHSSHYFINQNCPTCGTLVTGSERIFVS